MNLRDLHRIEATFSASERRRIRRRICVPLERAIRSSRHAFKVFGQPCDELPDMWTVFLSAIVPAALEEQQARLERLAAFWRLQWDAASDRTARGAARRAHEALVAAMSAIDAWLMAIEPQIIEQHRRGMPAGRLLPLRELDRMRALDEPPTRPILEDERRELLRELRAAVRKDGGVVNPAVLDGLFNLAGRGDANAIESLRRVREVIRQQRDGF